MRLQMVLVRLKDAAEKAAAKAQPLASRLALLTERMGGGCATEPLPQSHRGLRRTGGWADGRLRPMDAHTSVAHGSLAGRFTVA